ncbi:MAG: acyl-ACP--UDP-N-acetylglucosamine O-acyltransferase [bacterium]|nr:acyl-ACP--UDP-N-acetylglucosamine O-acyltransferase [bacterium]
MPLVHPSSIVHPEARLAEDVIVGPFSCVGSGVTIGAGTVLKSHVVIEGPTKIGEHNTIFPFAVIGVVPQDLKFEGEPSETIIGDSNTLREGVTIHRGTQASMRTQVGSGCLLMAYSHVAHDCVVGSGVILANVATLAGHVTVDDYAIIGGLTGVQQFNHVGAYSYTGGGCMVTQGIPPFMRVYNYPATHVGSINDVGLKRHGFSDERVGLIKRAYRILYRSGLAPKGALERIKAELEPNEDIARLTAFLESADRGIVKGGGRWETGGRGAGGEA